MDFSKYDARSRAESGFPFPILDPVTREPITDGKTDARFFIRGWVSETVQAATIKAARAGLFDTAEDRARKTIAFAHEQAVRSALPYVAGFEGVERDGEPLPADEAGITWLLNLFLPEFGPDPDDKTRIRMVNYPFAFQVLDRAAEVKALLGNASGG